MADQVGLEVSPRLTFIRPSTSPTYYGLGPGTSANYERMCSTESDVVTMIRGRHSLHFGGELIAFRADSTAWGNINLGEPRVYGCLYPTRKYHSDVSRRRCLRRLPAGLCPELVGSRLADLLRQAQESGGLCSGRLEGHSQADLEPRPALGRKNGMDRCHQE